MTYALKTTKPLVGVLRMVDLEKMSRMGFLYGAMDKAKEQIAENLGGLGRYGVSLMTSGSFRCIATCTLLHIFLIPIINMI